MANSDYERRQAHDYIDQHSSDRYDANSWGMVIGIAAVVGIIAMLFIGFGSVPNSPQTQPTTIERTTPAPTPTAPSTQPVTTPN
jgi:hypothetical protein